MSKPLANPGENFSMIEHATGRAGKNVLRWVAAVLFLVGVPLAAHLTLSWIGYNPTDDGFTLAYSRRILDGQIPHLDFIIIRPFLSPVIHVPFVWLAGDNLYWISRGFIWFQLACLAWIWTMIINRALDKPLGIIEQWLLALTALAFSTNHWPLLAWHTIDGLWLAAMGAALCIQAQRGIKFTGYLLLASAYLCKQSFVFAAPLAIFILKDWRDLRLWLAVAFPAIAYVLYLSLTGSLYDAWIQFTAHTSLENIIDKYANNLTAYLFFGYLALRWITGAPPSEVMAAHRHRQQRLGLVLIWFIVGFEMTWSLWYGKMYGDSFALFWLLVGALGYIALERRFQPTRIAQTWLLILLLAGCSSISIGACSPDLMAGPMAVALLVATLAVVQKRWIKISLSLILAVASLTALWQARHSSVYHESPANQLTASLDGVFRGSRHLKTNPNTAAFLVDLNKAVALAKSKSLPYAIIPDFPGYWARSPQPNLLPIDWVKNTEISDPRLLQRVIQTLDGHRGQLIVIVQKVEAFPLAKQFKPLANSQKFATVRYVRKTFRKIAETKYFDLYQ